MSVAAVLLAAGASPRFSSERSKLLDRLQDRPLILWALDPALAADLDEVVVVTGAYDLSVVLPEGITLLSNEMWSSGRASGLRAAADWCARRGHEALVVGLADQPWLSETAWRALAAPFPTPVAVATYAGRRDHPVRLEAAVWALLPVSGDEGVQALMRSRPELVTEVPCEGNPRDIDSMEDLRRWS
jgi:molybdenum cofactor cytidylyltransferase